MYRNYIINNSDITDFNEGSVMRAILESNSEIASQIQMDHLIAIMRAIPVALFESFKFKRRNAIASTGFLVIRRKPVMSLKYIGVGGSAKITITSTDFQVAVVGQPADALSLAIASFPEVDDLVTEINNNGAWEATSIKNVPTENLFKYDEVEIVGQTDYNNESGFSLMLESDIEIPILNPYSVTINNIVFSTIIDGILPAGAVKASLNSGCSRTGVIGNIGIKTIDTENGKGFASSAIPETNIINFTSFSGGQNEETETQRKIRFNEAILSLNAGTAKGIVSEIKKIEGVLNAGIRPNFPFKGVNTIVVDDGSGIVSSELIAKVHKALDGDPNDLENFPGKGTAGIGVNIVAPTIVAVAVNISVQRLSRVRVSLDEIKEDVKNAVETYINTLQLGQPVLISEIIKVSKNSNAGVYDMVVNAPTSNVSVNEEEFARTGDGTGASVNVTVSIV